MNLTTDEANDLMDELVRLDVKMREPGDIDRYQYAEKLGMSPKGAEARLIEFVKRGILVPVSVYDPDRRRQLTVYRKAK